MTNRLDLGSIDLIATRRLTGTGEYEWVEHDEQPSYSFTFDEAGCADGCGGTGVLSKDTLNYVVRPITFTCYTANSKTAAVNRDNLLAVLDSATAFTLRATCNPAYTGAAVLEIRQFADQAVPDVWTVKRYQVKATRLDLNRNRIMLDVDLYCAKGGPVLDPETGMTEFGGNGNPVQGGMFEPIVLRMATAEFTRTGGNPPRDLGTFGPAYLHMKTAAFTRTGGS